MSGRGRDRSKQGNGNGYAPGNGRPVMRSQDNWKQVGRRGPYQRDNSSQVNYRIARERSQSLERHQHNRDVSTGSRYSVLDHEYDTVDDDGNQLEYMDDTEKNQESYDNMSQVSTGGVKRPKANQGEDALTTRVDKVENPIADLESKISKIRQDVTKAINGLSASGASKKELGYLNDAIIKIMEAPELVAKASVQVKVQENTIQLLQQQIEKTHEIQLQQIHSIGKKIDRMRDFNQVRVNPATTQPASYATIASYTRYEIPDADDAREKVKDTDIRVKRINENKGKAYALVKNDDCTKFESQVTGAKKTEKVNKTKGYPTIKLYDFYEELKIKPEEHSKIMETLRNEKNTKKFKEDNSAITEDLLTVQSGKGKHPVCKIHPKFYRYLGLSPDDRRTVSLHFGYTSINIVHHDQVVVCNRCGEFGHIRKYCTSPKMLKATNLYKCTWCPDIHQKGSNCPRKDNKEEPICRYCRENHPTGSFKCDYTREYVMKQRLNTNFGYE